MATKFKKGDLIQRKDHFFKCIVADDETAVFGKIKNVSKGTTQVSHEKLFSVSNIDNDDFKFEMMEMADVRKRFEGECCGHCDCYD